MRLDEVGRHGRGMNPRATHRGQVRALPRVLGRRGLGRRQAFFHVGHGDGLVREPTERAELRRAEVTSALRHHRLGIPVEEVGGAPKQVVTVEALSEQAVRRHRAQRNARSRPEPGPKEVVRLSPYGRLLPKLAYRESGETKDLSIDPEEILAAQKRASRRRLAVVAVVLVVLGASVAGALFVLQARAKKAVKVAYGRFAMCTVGQPLGANEKASLRVRAAQLVAMSTPKEQRMSDVGKEAWPTRCSPLTQAFAATVRDNDGNAELVAATEKLGKALATETAFSTDLGPLVDDVFAKAKASSLDGERETDVTAPPTVAKAATLAMLPREARLVSPQTTLAGVHASPFTDTTLRFIVDEKDSPVGPVSCAIAPGEKEISCARIPAPAAQASPALRMWGTTNDKAHALAFAGDRGKSGIFDAVTGARIVDKLEYGAYGATSLADGALAYLVWNEKPPSTNIAIVGKDSKSKSTKVVDRSESGNPYYSSAIFWEWIAYKQVRKGADGIRLVVRSLENRAQDGASLIGPPVDIGRIDEVGHIEGGTEEDPHLTACRNGTTMVLRAKGRNDTFLYFKRDTWSAAIAAHGQHGVLTCGDNTATITKTWGDRVGAQRFRGGAVVTECTVSGCKEHIVDIDKVLGSNDDLTPREKKDLRAIDVGGKLLVVWSAGDRGGVRMRVSAPKQLATAPETILLDDHIRDDTFRDESTLVGLELLPFGKNAVLLLGTIEGVYAFLVDAEGKLSALPTRMQ